jgi:molybdate transport system substrate-binding protein
MKISLLLILLLLIICGCQTRAPLSDDNLTISAAASLKDAFNERGSLYKSKTGRTVNFNFGSSGVLQKQIETGAPIDIFASAGEKQMDEIAAGGLIDAKTRRNFARNTLVLIVSSETKLNLASFVDLTKLDVQKIAVGNPRTVPAGQYTEQVFDKLGLKDAVQPKLVLAEDVRQVLDWVIRGEADAGIVYATDERIAGDRASVVATASEDTHEPILYPIAIISNSQQKQAAQEFIGLVLSAEGQAILQKYGFASAS